MKCVAVLFLFVSLLNSQPASAESPEFKELWEQAHTLIDLQRNNAADSVAVQILELAQAKGDQEQ